MDSFWSGFAYLDPKQTESLDQSWGPKGARQSTTVVRLHQFQFQCHDWVGHLKRGSTWPSIFLNRKDHQVSFACSKMKRNALLELFTLCVTSTVASAVPVKVRRQKRYEPNLASTTKQLKSHKYIFLPTPAEQSLKIFFGPYVLSVILDV